MGHISTYEMTILATKIIQIDQMTNELWPFSKRKEIKMFSPMGSCGFFTIFTLRIYSWTILVIMISIYTRESITLATKIIKIGQWRHEMCPIFKSKETKVFLIEVF